MRYVGGVDFSNLSRIVRCDLDLIERQAHARDLWPRLLLSTIAGEKPDAPAAVVWPESESEVAAVLRWASDREVPVVPWGAGSGVCGAAAGRSDAIALDLKRMRTIGPVDVDARLVEVDAGVIGQHLEDELEASGWATRHSPSSIWCSTVGGWAASRSAGQFSSRYGKFEDMVVGTRVVSPSESFGTGRWASGTEDLGPWVIGAEGALGVITRLLVRVSPVATTRVFRAYRFRAIEHAFDAMRALMQGHLHPAALRLYDPADTRLAGKGTVERPAPAAGGAAWLARFGREVQAVPALRHLSQRLPLSLPRLVNALVDAFATDCVLIDVGRRDRVDGGARRAGVPNSGGAGHRFGSRTR